jgi:hypothetical protein
VRALRRGGASDRGGACRRRARGAPAAP